MISKRKEIRNNGDKKSNVCNIGVLMRSQSNGFRVSPCAVQEMLSRIDLWFETNMKELCEVTKGHGRHTISDDDVTEFFSRMKSEFLGG